MSYLHYFTNRYRNRVSRKREFFNLYKIFVIQNKQKAIRFSFQNLTALLSCCVPKSSIFTCNICTKSRGLFSGYFSAAYAFRTLILLTFGRSFQRVPWQINNTLIIFLYLHLSLVFLLKRLIFQGFPTFEFSFLFKVSSQIFSYFLVFFPAILVNPLVKQASLPTGFFNYSLSDILLPLHHQNLHGCKCSRLH